MVVAAIEMVLSPSIDRSLAFHKWDYKALLLVVTACPWALVISTPVDTTCGSANAARIGLPIKGERYLESLGKLKVIVFYQIGTLTEGILWVVDVIFVEDTGVSILWGWDRIGPMFLIVKFVQL